MPAQLPQVAPEPPQNQPGGYDDPAGTNIGPTHVNDDPAETLRKQKEAADAAQAQAQAQAQAAAAAEAINAHFQYGGYANGANDAAARYAGLGAAAQGRAAPQIDYGVANDDHNRNVITSQGQNAMAGLLAARANGSMPLISGMRANQDMNRAIADQSSIAASARGPAGLALAQQQQANNSASAVSNISNNAQINGAQEQLNNTVAAGQAYTGIRQGDQALQAQDAAQATAQGQLNQAARDSNDRYQLGMTGYETGVQQAQLGAQGNQVAIAAGQQQARAALAQNQNQYDSSRVDKYVGMGLGAAGTAAAVGAAILGGGSGGSGPPPNSTVGGGSVTNPGGGGGNNDFGAPGSTPGGYDAGTGAPVAGSGGGYDPDHPGDTSDITAKQNIRPADGGAVDPRAAAWDRGHNEALNKVQQYRVMPPQELKGLAARGDRVAAAVLGAKADAYDEARGRPQHIMQGGGIPTRDPIDFQRGDPNDTTGQLANGLAPSTYDYKPGYGTPGEKFGPMANNMAENPATATAVRQGDDGLLSIDKSDGLKVALGGVGHLAQKQTQTDEELQRIKGLLAQQPSIGQRYLAAVRGGR